MANEAHFLGLHSEVTQVVETLGGICHSVHRHQLMLVVLLLSAAWYTCFHICK